MRVMLVHSRYDPGDTSNEYLVGYYFKDGRFFKKDTVLHRNRLPGSDDDGRISIGLGREEIFDERYLFSSIGILVDLWNKKLIWEKSNLSFVKHEQGKIYFHRCFFSTTLELYVHDLENHGYKHVLSRPFEGYCFDPELCAPDYNHFLETTYDSPGKTAIFLIDSKGKRKKIIVTSKQESFYSGSRARGELPILWVDEFRFIYPNYIDDPKRRHAGVDTRRTPGVATTYYSGKPDSLPSFSVELNEFDIRDNSTRFVTTINGLYAPRVDNRIYQKEKDHFIFRNLGADTNQYFLVNRFNGVVKPYEFPPSPFKIDGGDLTSESEEDLAEDVIFNGNKIGTFYVRDEYYNDSTIVICGSKEKAAPEALFVWSTRHPQWQEFPVSGFLQVLGWINKPDNE